MKRNATDSEEILARAIREIRGMSASAEEEGEVLARVKSALSAEQGKVVPHPSASAVHKAYLTGCEDFQSLIPEYLSSRLTPSRTLLLQDHLMECAVCWKLFEGGAAKSRPRALQGTASPRKLTPSFRSWRAAAAIAACILVGIVVSRTSLIRNFMWPIDVNARLQTVNGKVYRVLFRDIRAATSGERIHDELIRTGLASGAVLELADGSRIEMNERTELSLNQYMSDGVTIYLRRGNIIVAAAKQHGGHLYVKTPDSRVTVVGTLFAVTAAAKGSRVSVLEGQVQVQYSAQSQPVRAGEQVTTNPALPPVGLADEIAWSRDLNNYLTMLQKFAGASQLAAQSLEIAGLRYKSSLVPVVPEDTVLVASFPNVEGSILQSYDMLQARISENTIMDQWWNRQRAPISAMVRVAARVSKYLGPEIVIAAPLTMGASAPVVLANATSPDALAAALRTDPDLASGPAAVNAGLMVLSSSPAQIQKTLAYQAQFGSNRFQSTALYQRLAKAYTEGVGWLLAADLEKIKGQGPDAGELQNFGLENMKELVVEQKIGRDGPAFFQTLGFKQARTGLMSWLGDPSSMGALEFVSPNAYSAAGVVTKDPKLILDDLYSMLSRVDEGRGAARAFADIDKFQQENNVDIRRDVASSLGNEFLVALDGPVLPAPSWKVVIEVTDPARLQNALSWSFNELNRRAALEQKPKWSVTSENRGGWTYYKAVLEGFSTEIDYTFLGGYLLIAPNRELLVDAGRWWGTGSSLARSTEFRQQLPADGRTDFSGFVYHNIKSLTDAVPGGLLSGVNVKFPTLVCLYGYPDRVVVSSKGVLGTDILSAERLGVLPAAIVRR